MLSWQVICVWSAIILSGNIPDKILNIHPSLLPAFKGMHAIKDAFDYGVKVTGPTVHIVVEEMDAGPIILQEPVRIDPEDTLESLEEKIHQAEHRIYPQAIDLFVRGKLKIEGRKVILNHCSLKVVLPSSKMMWMSLPFDFDLSSLGLSSPKKSSCLGVKIIFFLVRISSVCTSLKSLK